MQRETRVAGFTHEHHHIIAISSRSLQKHPLLRSLLRSTYIMYVHSSIVSMAKNLDISKHSALPQYWCSEDHNRFSFFFFSTLF